MLFDSSFIFPIDQIGVKDLSSAMDFGVGNINFLNHNWKCIEIWSVLTIAFKTAPQGLLVFATEKKIPSECSNLSIWGHVKKCCIKTTLASQRNFHLTTMQPLVVCSVLCIVQHWREFRFSCVSQVFFCIAVYHLIALLLDAGMKTTHTW